MLQPPDPRQWPPERLFRLLLGAPRPRIPLDLRIAGAERVALEVRALRPLEEAAAVDEAAQVSVERRTDLLEAGLVVAALWTLGGPAFRSAADLGLLFADEAAALARTTLAALGIVSPSYRRSDAAAWGRALREGAQHPTNLGLTARLGGCVEVGWRFSPRPDWFFGLPLGELTDGQWMAFRAAREVVATWEKR